MHVPSVPPPQLRRAFRRLPTKYRLQPTMESHVAEPSQELIKLLSEHRLDRFAWPLHEYGVRCAADVPWLSNGDLARIGMGVVQIRQIRDCTGQPHPASQIDVQHAMPTPSAEDKLQEEKQREPDHRAAPDGSQSAERSAASVAERSDQGCVPANKIVTGASPQGTCNWCVPTSNDRDPTSAHPSDLREAEPVMVEAMKDKRQVAEKKLLEIRETIHVPSAVAICLQSALNHMSLHEHAENYRQAAKAAACAMSSVTRAKASCPAADRDLREGIKQAEMTLRDLLILATQLQCPLGGRDVFVAHLEIALDLAAGALTRTQEKQDKHMLSQLMHSHSKVLNSLQLTHGFLSNSKNEANRRGGTRPARTGDRGGTKPEPRGQRQSSERSAGSRPQQSSERSAGSRIPGFRSPPGLHPPADTPADMRGTLGDHGGEPVPIVYQ